MTKERSRLSLDGFESKPIHAQEPTEIARQIGEQAGFSARHSNVPAVSSQQRVDARSLRRTTRTDQINIAVETETRNDFWLLASEGGFDSGGSFLKELLRLYREKR